MGRYAKRWAKKRLRQRRRTRILLVTCCLLLVGTTGHQLYEWWGRPVEPPRLEKVPGARELPPAGPVMVPST